MFEAFLKNLNESQIAIIGLGYVGLPLAVAFAEKYPTIGFDINPERVKQLQQGKDLTLEVNDQELKQVLVSDEIALNQTGKGLLVSTDVSSIADAAIFIVTVPTPTDKHNRPVLTPMIKWICYKKLDNIFKPVSDLI